MEHFMDGDFIQNFGFNFGLLDLSFIDYLDCYLPFAADVLDLKAVGECPVAQLLYQSELLCKALAVHLFHLFHDHFRKIYDSLLLHRPQYLNLVMQAGNQLKSRTLLTQLLNQQIERNEELQSQNQQLLSRHRKLIALLQNKDVQLANLQALTPNKGNLETQPSTPACPQFELSLDFQRRVQQPDKMCKKAQQKIVCLQQQLKRAKLIIEQNQIEYQQLFKQSEAINLQLQERTGEAHSLADKLRICEEAKSSQQQCLQDACQQWDREKNQLMKALQSRGQQLNSITQSLKSLNQQREIVKQFKSLKLENASLAEFKLTASQQLQSSHSKLNTLSAELQSCLDRIRILTSDKNGLQETIREMEKQRKQASSQHQIVLQKLANQMSISDQLQKSLCLANKKLQQSNSGLLQLQKVKSSAELSWAQEKARLEVQLKELSKTVRQLNQRVEQLNQCLKQKDEQSAFKQNLAESNKKKSLETARQNKRLQRELKVKEQQVNQLKVQAEQRQETYSSNSKKMSQKCKRLEAQNSNIKKQLNEIEKQFTDVIQSYDIKVAQLQRRSHDLQLKDKRLLSQKDQLLTLSTLQEKAVRQLKSKLANKQNQCQQLLNQAEIQAHKIQSLSTQHQRLMQFSQQMNHAKSQNEQLKRRVRELFDLQSKTKSQLNEKNSVLTLMKNQHDKQQSNLDKLRSQLKRQMLQKSAIQQKSNKLVKQLQALQEQLLSTQQGSRKALLIQSQKIKMQFNKNLLQAQARYQKLKQETNQLRAEQASRKINKDALQNAIGEYNMAKVKIIRERAYIEDAIEVEKQKSLKQKTELLEKINLLEQESKRKDKALMNNQYQLTFLKQAYQKLKNQYKLVCQKVTSSQEKKRLKKKSQEN